VYLSPEPLLQDPHFTLFGALQGRSYPTYAYALNNPLRYVDASGLDPGDAFDTPDQAAIDALDYLKKKHKKRYKKVEFCSRIYQSGTKFYSTPFGTDDDPEGCHIPAAPKKTKPVADCHNHPGSSPRDEDFSGEDKDTNDGNFEQGFLLTPTEVIKRYSPVMTPGTIPVVNRRQGSVTTIRSP
jgi:hypothetical protein